MNKIVLITAMAACVAILAGCSNSSASGPKFIDTGANRKDFIEQKGEDPTAPDLPDAAPIESDELHKMLNDAAAQAAKNKSDGDKLSEKVNGFDPGVLDTNGMDATRPDNSGVKLPDDWKNPTIADSTGPNISDLDGDLSDKDSPSGSPSPSPSASTSQANSSSTSSDK